MKYYIFSVRDRVAGVYGTPYYAVSKGSAIRGFSDEVNRREPGNTLAAHPDDFELFCLGEFEDGHAVFELYAHPESIALGKEYVVNIN